MFIRWSMYQRRSNSFVRFSLSLSTLLFWSTMSIQLKIIFHHSRSTSLYRSTIHTSTTGDIDLDSSAFACCSFRSAQQCVLLFHTSSSLVSSSWHRSLSSLFEYYQSNQFDSSSCSCHLFNNNHHNRSLSSSPSSCLL